MPFKILKSFLRHPGSISILDELEEYFKYIVKLGYDQQPDYNKLRKIFQDGLRKRRLSDDGQGVIFKSGQDSEKLSNGYLEDDDGDCTSMSDKVKTLIRVSKFDTIFISISYF